MKPSTLHSGIWVTVVCALLSVPPTAGIVRNANSGIYYPTITQAVTAAVNGDQLNVATGVYAEFVQIISKQLEIRGGYDTNCTTKIPGGKAVISEPAGDGPYLSHANVYFSDVYVTNMHNFGLNVRHGSVVTCQYCAFFENEASAFGNGGGLCVRENSEVTLLSSLVRDNYARGMGGGAYVGAGSRLTLHAPSADLKGNVAQIGGGIAVEGGTVIVGNHFSVHDNHADLNGGAIFATNGAVVVIAGPEAYVGNLGKGNAASNGAGGAVCAIGSTVVISNGSTIARGVAATRGGGIYAKSSHVALQDAALYYNTAGNYGGAICVDVGASLAATNASMEWNACTNSPASYGGAIYSGNQGLGAYLFNCTIVSNVASASGGGVCMYSGSRHGFVNCMLNCNHAGDDGGALWQYTTSAVCVAGGEMMYNTADRDGGGIFSTYGDLLCRDVDIRMNQADDDANGIGDGGGICLKTRIEVESQPLYGVAGDIGTCTVQAEAVPTLVGANHARRGGGVYANQNHALVVCAAPGANVQMASNIAFGPGGAIYAEGLASVAVTGNVRIAQNVSYSSGGGICVSNRAQLVCTGTAAGQPSLYLNSADENGGGIAAIGAGVTVRLDNVEIGRVGWPNTARGGATFAGGGGMALQDGAFLEAADTRVAGNVSLRKGGGLYMHTARASIGGFAVQAGGVLPANAFVGNTATGGVNTGGGGIYCLASQLAVENALMCSNVTEDNGGAIQCDAASVADLVNLLVCHNTAEEYGAGIRVYNAGMRMRHCTMAHNYTNGVDYGGGATVTLSNCIVWGHSGLQVAPGLQVHYCDIEDGYSGGTFILDLAPEFADWTALDYRLTPGSPCIDAGTNVGVYFDCINTPRPELLGFDMGAYEFVPEPLGGMGIAVLAAFWRRRETS